MQLLINRLQDVVQWNAVANTGENDLSDEAIQRQIGYIKSELRETASAAAAGNAVETIDGVADVFVTLGYYLFMKGLTYKEISDGFGNDDYALMVEEYNANPEGGVAYAEMLIGQIASGLWFDFEDLEGLSENDSLFSDMVCLIALAESTYGVDMFDAIDAVMQSNWSKYPPAVEVLAPDTECRDIESQGYKNVRYALVTTNGKEYYVFRDSYGQGKIRKPTSYAAPTKALTMMVEAATNLDQRTKA